MILPRYGGWRSHSSAYRALFMQGSGPFGYTQPVTEVAHVPTMCIGPKTLRRVFPNDSERWPGAAYRTGHGVHPFDPENVAFTGNDRDPGRGAAEPGRSLTLLA